MNIFRTNSSFLLAIAFFTATIVPSAVASECDDQFGLVAFFGSCAPAEGSDQCPATCQEGLDELDTICSGSTLNDEPYAGAESLLGMLMLVDEACSPTVADEVLAQTDDTCQEWADVYIATAVLFCNDDAVCSEFCKDVQDGFYLNCAAADEIMLEDWATGEMITVSVSQLAMGSGSLMGDACKEYEEGKEFKKPTTPAPTPTTPAPTQSPTPAPTPAPTPTTPAPTQAPIPAPTSPLGGELCSDNTQPFMAFKEGWDAPKAKECNGWVTRKSTPWRCYAVAGVKENCPLTCLNCCVENTGTFTLYGSGEEKTCDWVRQNPDVRCSKPPARQNCPITCNQCDGYPYPW